MSLRHRPRRLVSFLVGSALVVASLAAVAVPATSAIAATLPPPFGYTVTVTPTQVSEGSPATIVATITADISLLGSVRVALPPKWTLTQPFTATAKAGTNTTVTQHTCTATDPAPCSGAGTVVVQADGGSHPIVLSQQLTVSFKATPPNGTTALAAYAWNTEATSGSRFTGVGFAPKLPVPTTTVVAGPASHFVVSAPGTATAGVPITPDR